MPYSVYILKSIKDGGFYVGQTSNVDKRLMRHNKGIVPSTKHRTPLVLVYEENFDTRSEAVKREQYFKTQEGGSFIKKFLSGSGAAGSAPGLGPGGRRFESCLPD